MTYVAHLPPGRKSLIINRLRPPLCGRRVKLFLLREAREFEVPHLPAYPYAVTKTSSDFETGFRVSFAKNFSSFAAFVNFLRIVSLTLLAYS